MVSTKSRMPSCGGLYAWLLFDFCPTEYLAHIHMVKSRVYLIDLGGIYLYIHSPPHSLLAGRDDEFRE